MTVRKRLYELLETPHPHDGLGRAIDVFIMSLIVLNVLAVILSTVEDFHGPNAGAFRAFNIFTVAVFSVEYVLRSWVSVESPRFQGSILGRLRYATTPIALVDLLSILPFYVVLLGLNVGGLRALRMLRLLRLAKLTRYSKSLRLIFRVITRRRAELLGTTGVMLFLLVASASALYFAERRVQPEAFSSIPASMWWAVSTLTTVGYGDVYPITALGKLIGGITAVLGIGLFALPTGIIGAAFVNELSHAKKGERPEECPHCGGLLDSEVRPRPRPDSGPTAEPSAEPSAEPTAEPVATHS